MAQLTTEYLDKKIKDLGTSFDKKLDDQLGKFAVLINNSFQATQEFLLKEIRRVEKVLMQRLDRLEKRMGNLEKELENIKLEISYSATRSDLKELEERVYEIERKLGLEPPLVRPTY